MLKYKSLSKIVLLEENIKNPKKWLYNAYIQKNNSTYSIARELSETLKLNINNNAVRKYLICYRIPLRSPNYNKPKISLPIDEIRLLRNNGKSLREIAIKYHVSIPTISDRLKS